MPDQVSVLLEKNVLLKLSAVIWATVGFAYIAPIEQLAPFQSIQFTDIFFVGNLIYGGIVLIVEYFRNLPDAGNHFHAKTGAYVFLIAGIISFGLGMAIILGMFDPTTDRGFFNGMVSAFLALIAIIAFIAVIPEIRERKTTAKKLRQMF